MNQLYEDFTNRVIDTNRWTTTLSGGGSTCSILAGSLNGLLRMVAGAGGVNRACELTTQAISSLTNGYYQRGNNPVFETKVTLSSLTNDIAYAGFTDTRVTIGSNTNPNTNHAYFAKRSTDTNWQCVTDDGGATETYTDTGVVVAIGVAYRLRVELRSGSTPETICTIDDNTTVTKTVVTATQPGATSPMDAYLAIMVTANTTAKNMDVDYVRVWQDNPITEVINAEGELVEEVTEVLEEPLPSLIPTQNQSEAVSVVEESVLSTSLLNLIKNLFESVVEFFGSVVFHGDTTFFGHTTVSKDAAGYVIVKAGEREVSVLFEKEYEGTPVVTVTNVLAGDQKIDEQPKFAVFDISSKGFKVTVSKSISSDLYFSWTAVAIEGSVNLSTSKNDIDQDPVDVENPVVVESDVLPIDIEQSEPASSSSADGILE